MLAIDRPLTINMMAGHLQKAPLYVNAAMRYTISFLFYCLTVCALAVGMTLTTLTTLTRGRGLGKRLPFPVIRLRNALP